MSLLGVTVVLITVLIVLPLFGSTEVAGWVKALIVLPILGGGILLAIVIRDRYRDSQGDKYKNIEL